MFGVVSGSGGRCPEMVTDYLKSVAARDGILTCSEHMNVLAPSILDTKEVFVALSGSPGWASGAAGESMVADVCAAYLKDGENFLCRLTGGFSLFLLDRRTDLMMLAIDRMGIGSLSWTMDGDSLLFSTSASVLSQRPGAVHPVRSQAIYDYFFFHMTPAPRSVFQGVQKLNAATALVWRPGGQPEERRYWSPDMTKRRLGGRQAAAEQLHCSLRKAVECCNPDQRTGAFLSGGLDSSTVAGMLSRTLQDAPTFSMGFDVPEFDELEYARITSNHFSTIPHELVITPDDLLEAIPVVAAHSDEPFGNSSAVPTYLCAKFAAEHGLSRLLAGDGGDELFGGNERYARHRVFEWYQSVPALLRDPFTAIVKSSIAPESTLLLPRKLRSYVEQATIPLPDRFESWNFVYREGKDIMFEPEFLDQVDTQEPMMQMRQVWDEVFRTGADLLDTMMIYDWKFTLADNDLRKVSNMCSAAGIKVDFPMLHNDVVDFSLTVPSEWKMSGTRLRTFYKQAMKGFLPDKTLRKQKKGFGLPFGIWLKSSSTLADKVYGNLSDLKHRRIVRGEFLDQLIRDHQKGHPGYFGYIIWDLIILEEWFKHHPETQVERVISAC